WLEYEPNTDLGRRTTKKTARGDCVLEMKILVFSLLMSLYEALVTMAFIISPFAICWVVGRWQKNYRRGGKRKVLRAVKRSKDHINNNIIPQKRSFVKW
ncbi:MAG: hypothetical protein PUF72_09465, partial [Clostridiales bacterium]|nr:hypothetical protein [Clostridiales bacterium]